ncbi:ZmpA/ZmpB/ZmpC family metallo-endopeptidase-related protein [Psychrobacillus sp. FSL H8-0510]|uniref:ZmpA/ZmpB/ZmpC family metallo-endopeptidase-related protein n=1 Tax=Psychrobacillus sp. FSL H8-0510 TaxID=2921394 RepID=UPI0030FA75BF
MKKEKREKQKEARNVLSSSLVRFTLAASLLLSGVTGVIGPLSSSNGIVGVFYDTTHAEATGIFAGGTGTVEDPYLIENSSQLSFMGNFKTSYFKLNKDISLAEINWMPIPLFEGVLDGNNYTISDFKYSGTSGALFSILKNASVKNLNIENVQNSSTGSASALSITAFESNFDNITAEGTIKGNSVGGLIQTMTNSVATNISVDLSLESKGLSGGIVGSASKSTLKNIYSSGSIKHNSSAHVGGLIGYASSNTQVENGISKMYMDISNSAYSGGLFGSFSGNAKNLYAFNEFSKANVLVNEKAIGVLVNPSNISNIYAPSNSFVTSSFKYITHFFTPSSEILDMQRDYGVLLTGSDWEIKKGLNYPIPSNLTSNFEVAPLQLDNSENLSNEKGVTVNLIKNRGDLENIKYNLSGNYVLQNDIDLTGEQWMPIGKGLANPVFNGKLSGNGFTINGLTIRDNTRYVGFFAETNGANIENINFTNVDVQGTHSLGSIAGQLRNSNLSKMSVKGIVKGTYQVGGIAGSVTGSTLKEVYTNLNVSGTVNSSVSNGNADVGGFFGHFGIGKLTIENSYLKGSVSALGPNVGGIIGYLNGPPVMNIKNVYVANGISSNASSNVGGAFGEVKTTGSTYNSKNLVIENLFMSNPYLKDNSSSTSSRHYAFAGFSNFTNNGVIASQGIRFYKNSIFNPEPTGHLAGVTQSIQEEQTLQRNTYLLKNWSFGVFGDEAVWGIDEGQTYPYLLFNPEKSMYNQETGKWEEVELNDELSLATESVEKAESSKLQADVDASRLLVSAVSNDLEKTSLIERLDAVQTAIDGSNATYEEMMVELADMKTYLLIEEGTREDVLAMRDVLKIILDDSLTLLNTTHRTNVGNYIQDILDIIDLLEMIWDKIANGELAGLDELVSQLPDSALKDNTEQEVEEAKGTGPDPQTDLDIATASVMKAESTKLPADVEASRSLVNNLSESIDKENLKNRLDAVQVTIDEAAALAEQIEIATTVVVKAERSKLQVDIDAARTLVTALPNGTVKTELSNRLDGINSEENSDKLLEDAKQAVDALENNSTKEQIAEAKELVIKLPNSPEKNALLDKITEIELIQKAYVDVSNAEKLPTSYNISIAEKSIQKLAEDSIKGELSDRMKELKLTIEAENKVKSAESTKREPYITNAMVSVNKLKAGPKKTELAARIKVIQDSLAGEEQAALLVEAINQVYMAEQQKREPYIANAIATVAKLQDGPDKVALEKRLQRIKDAAPVEPEAPAVDLALLKSAETQVSYAERYKRDPYLTRAQEAINKLTNGYEKAGLQTRLDALLVEENDKLEAEKLQAVTVLVTKAETAGDLFVIEEARSLVNGLANSEAKTELTKRLDAIEVTEAMQFSFDLKGEIDVVTDAVIKGKLLAAYDAVKLAKERQSSTYMAKAIASIDTLSLYEATHGEMIEKIATYFGNVQEEIETQKLIAAADNAVTLAERYKRAPYFTKAQSAINVLIDGKVKADLQARLDEAMK